MTLTRNALISGGFFISFRGLIVGIIVFEQNQVQNLDDVALVHCSSVGTVLVPSLKPTQLSTQDALIFLTSCRSWKWVVWLLS